MLDAAYDLFSREGLNSTGVDTVIARAGVAKMTLYRNFQSKDDLALAFMDRREERWTYGMVVAEAGRRGETPVERLLAIFDVFDDWFREPGFEGCAFINVMLELPDRESRVRAAAVRHLANIRTFIAGLAAEAGIADADAFARQWHILMKGSIVAAGEGDLDAAVRAKALGRLLLAERGF